MSIAREYARTLRKHLGCRPVWPPMLDIAPGDYGVFRGGVFSRIGNIHTDFGVAVECEPGGRRADKFQYSSEGTIGVAGGLTAAVAGAEAGLDIDLARRSSFFVSITALDVVRLRSPRAVATRLRTLPQWPFLRYYVVGELYSGRDLVFVGSESGGAAIRVRGNSEDLRVFQSVGKVGGSLQIAVTGAASAQFRGSADVVAGFGLGLFRVKQVGAVPLALAGIGVAGGDSPRGEAEGDEDEAFEALACDVDDDDDESVA